MGAAMRLNEREIHGATPMAGSAKNPIIVLETDDTVIVREGYSDRLVLQASSARFLARKLNRLALRIEKRAEALAIEAQNGSGGGENLTPNGGEQVPSK
jgi:hypothetical protein